MVRLKLRKIKKKRMRLTKTMQDVIEEERERLLTDYFDEQTILFSDNPTQETMRQAQKRHGAGIWNAIQVNPQAANILIVGKKTFVRKWTKKEIGIIKSVRTRKGNIAQAALNLGRSPNSAYKLIARLKQRGEIKLHK